MAILGAVSVGLVARAARRRGLLDRRRVAARLAWLSGRARGAAYRVGGGHPTPDVDDLTLADRVRSSIGALEKRLDVPHVHVLAEDHVVLLHGEVRSAADADAIEHAVLAVPGVLGVESYLHVGLVASDTPPSRGHVPARPSDALRSLQDAARAAGAGWRAPSAVRAVLGSLGGRLPDDTREHLSAHLPPDVQRLLDLPRRTGRTARVRTAAELVATVAADPSAVWPGRAPAIVEAIIGRLRLLVPDEVADVAAVLPEDLRRFWLGAVPG